MERLEGANSELSEQWERGKPWSGPKEFCSARFATERRRGLPDSAKAKPAAEKINEGNCGGNCAERGDQTSQWTSLMHEAKSAATGANDCGHDVSYPYGRARKKEPSPPPKSGGSPEARKTHRYNGKDAREGPWPLHVKEAGLKAAATQAKYRRPGLGGRAFRFFDEACDGYRAGTAAMALALAS